MKTIQKKSKRDFDSEEQIAEKLKFREKYGQLPDFLRRPTVYFEKEPALSFTFGAVLSFFVFVFYYFLFLRPETLFDFVADFVSNRIGETGEIGELPIFKSAILFIKSIETILLILLFFFFLPFIYYNEKHQRKIESAEEKIPPLLRDLSDLISGGLTLQEALVELSMAESVRSPNRQINRQINRQKMSDPFFEEIRLIGMKMRSGIPFEMCLEDLGKRYDSELIQKAASVIDAAEKSGGKMALSLDAAAFDLQEAVNLKKERSSKQNVYGTVLFLSFFLFIGIMILLIRRFESMSVLTSQTISQSSVFEMTIIIYHMLLIQSIFSGAAVGKFTKGKIAVGLKYSFGMLFAVEISFWAAGVFP